jgi:hypothetical protein
VLRPHTHTPSRRWLAPVRRQLSATVLASFQRSPQAVDRTALPEVLRAFNLLALTLEAPAAVSALRLWNYNKNAADTARGVKRVVVLAGERWRGSREGTRPPAWHYPCGQAAIAFQQPTTNTGGPCLPYRRCGGDAPRRLHGTACPRNRCL